MKGGPNPLDFASVQRDNAEIEALGGLAEVLRAAIADPTRARVTVVYVGPKPDLLRSEAQAIMTGHLGADGTFYAEELLLKCPTKYEEAVPEQALDFVFDEVREARLVPVIDFKGRKKAAQVQEENKQ